MVMVKERKNTQEIPEPINIRTADFGQISRFVLRNHYETERKYLANLRAHHGGSFMDYYSLIEFYTLIANNMPEKISPDINSKALKEFNTGGNRNSDVFIDLNIKTILLALNENLTGDIDTDNDLLQDTVLKLKSAKIQPAEIKKIKLYTYNKVKYHADKFMKSIKKEKRIPFPELPAEPDIAGDDAMVHDIFVKRTIENLRRSLKENFSARTSDILYERVIDGSELGEIGMRYGISGERVRQIAAITLVKIRHQDRIKKYPYLKYYKENIKR